MVFQLDSVNDYRISPNLVSPKNSQKKRGFLNNFLISSFIFSNIPTLIF